MATNISATTGVDRAAIENNDALYDKALSHLNTAFNIYKNVIKNDPSSVNAVQLAIALRFNRAIRAHGLKIVFVSGDIRLVTAAQSEGITADNPFVHVDLD